MLWRRALGERLPGARLPRPGLRRRPRGPLRLPPKMEVSVGCCLCLHDEGLDEGRRAEPAASLS